MLLTAEFQKVGNRPYAIRHASSHCRGHADRAVNLAKIVIGKIESNSRLEILKLLAKSVCETGKASAMHTQGVVLLFDVGG